MRADFVNEVARVLDIKEKIGRLSDELVKSPEVVDSSPGSARHTKE